MDAFPQFRKELVKPPNLVCKFPVELYLQEQVIKNDVGLAAPYRYNTIKKNFEHLKERVPHELLPAVTLNISTQHMEPFYWFLETINDADIFLDPMFYLKKDLKT